jgi:hypothetical protein
VKIIAELPLIKGNQDGRGIRNKNLTENWFEN